MSAAGACGPITKNNARRQAGVAAEESDRHANTST